MPLSPLKSPVNLFQKISGFSKGFITVVILFLSLIIINIFQCLSLITLPISREMFRSINRFFANTWWSVCDLWSEYLCKIDIHFTGDKIPDKENALIISNHQDMTDITSLFRLARRKKRIGDIKWFVKDILKFVPGIGWGMMFLDCIFLKRNWEKDETHVNKLFNKFSKYNIPIWAISFVEGTRIRPDKLSKSQNYANNYNLKALNHLLIPRTKGFAATVMGLRNHLNAVYDITIGYVDGVPTLWQWCQGYVNNVNIHVKRFAISELPLTEKEISKWLIERFEVKDELLEYYYNNDAFSKSD